MTSLVRKTGRFNKATASLVVGSILAVAGAFFAIDPEIKDAIQVLLVTAMVYWVPNKG